MQTPRLVTSDLLASLTSATLETSVIFIPHPLLTPLNPSHLVSLVHYSTPRPTALFFFFKGPATPRDLPSSPTRRSSDPRHHAARLCAGERRRAGQRGGEHDRSVEPRPTGEVAIGRERSRPARRRSCRRYGDGKNRSEEHTSELQSQSNLVCRLLLGKKKK